MPQRPTYIHPIYAYLVCIMLFLIAGADFNPTLADDNLESISRWDDSGEIDYREPPVNEIEKFINNPAYNYEKENDRPGLIQRIFYWIWQEIFSGIEGQGGVIRYIIIISIIIIGILLILKMLNIPITGFFSYVRKGELADIQLTATNDSNSERELEQLYQLYRNNRAYRESVRVLFLLYLKHLEKKGLITIRSWKTNREYYYELSDQQQQQSFKKIVKLYEYVWFGQFEPQPQHFDKIEEIIKQGMSASA